VRFLRQPERGNLSERLLCVPLFQQVGAEVLVRLAYAAVWRTYDTGAVVKREGEKAIGYYYIHAGWLKEIKTSLDGRSHTLLCLGPKSTFNLAGILADHASRAAVVALEPAGVWQIPQAAFRDLLAESPAFGLRLAGALADEAIDLVRLVTNLALRSVEARLAQCLLERAQEDVMVRRPWATQAELAALLGTVPDVLGRSLRKLEKEELILVARLHIRILDRGRLTAKAQA
jgi:CRP-like cAMP-binding protein